MKISTLVALLCATASCLGAGINFPGTTSCLSPDRRWSVRCVSQKRADGYRHKILLRNTGRPGERQIYESGRNCDVLWSADSGQLAITDWSGSNLSEIYTVDVKTAELRSLNVERADAVLSKAEFEGHNYHEALNWDSPSKLRIRIFGHTDENPSHGFAYYFVIELSTGTAHLLKSEDDEHG